jgi:rfaE bifunctional protein nucleotidyltransferase chain/domain
VPQSEPERKLVDREALKAVIAAARAQGQKTVFTNGCFDIIHPGHVRYLRDARGMGDMLIVGLNTDGSVSRLKPGRPINIQSDRAEVLCALDMVDYVTLFDEDTPYELIRFIEPDVLVKGGDWDPSKIIGSDLVPSTQSLPFEEGFSTTSIIERIRAGAAPEPQAGSHDAGSHDEWAEIFVTYDAIEADMVRDALNGAGIEARVVSLKVGPYPVNIGRMGEVKIYVPAKFEDEARIFLKEFGS